MWSRGWLGGVVVALVVALGACSGGDGGLGGRFEVMETGGADGGETSDVPGVDVATGADTGGTAWSDIDGLDDTRVSDSLDADVADTGLGDAGLMDAGLMDAGLMDAGPTDSGPTDSGLAGGDVWPFDVEPVDIEVLDIESRDIGSFDAESYDVSPADVESPDVESPDVESPDVVSPDVESPDAERFDAGPDIASFVPGERTLSGRAYFFDISASLSVTWVENVDSAVVSILEYPEVRTVAGPDGTFELTGLPDGVELTVALEHPDFFPSLTRTFVLDGQDEDDVTFQALSVALATVAAAIVGVDPGAPETCIMATTVTAVSDSMHGIWAVGEPGATVNSTPPIDAQYGPVYFNTDVIPDPSLSASTTDGGVVIAGPLAGAYVLHAEKEGVEFIELPMKCVPGWLTNAAPPHGLVALP